MSSASAMVALLEPGFAFGRVAQVFPDNPRAPPRETGSEGGPRAGTGSRSGSPPAPARRRSGSDGATISLPTSDSRARAHAMTPPDLRGGVDPLLTVADVAAVLRLSVRSVRRLIADNKLRVVRIGRAVRVRAEDLRSLLATSGQERP